MHENKTFFLFYNFLQCFDENGVFKYRICKPILRKVDKNNVVFFLKKIWTRPHPAQPFWSGPVHSVGDEEDKEEREADL